MQWHELIHLECDQMRICIEIAKSCDAKDRSKRPTISEIVHMLNETETTVQMLPPVINEPRNDPRSSLHQVWHSTQISAILCFHVEVTSEFYQ